MNANATSAAPTTLRAKPSRYWLPTLRGVIDRRILINYRCDPAALARILPAPFRPKLVNGHGVAGICLIRLQSLRPTWLSTPVGFSSENAAHRIAVQWDERGEARDGVFILRRDSDSPLNAWAGNRVFPGRHYLARFEVIESLNRFKLHLKDNDSSHAVRIMARATDQWPTDSLFSSLDEASNFFSTGSIGWSAGKQTAEFEAIELRCFRWQMEPLAVESLQSSFFDDRRIFPAGAAVFDSAVVMRNIEHEWVGRGRLSAHEYTTPL